MWPSKSLIDQSPQTPGSLQWSSGTDSIAVIQSPQLASINEIATAGVICSDMIAPSWETTKARAAPGLRRFDPTNDYADLTAATNFETDSLASPKSMDVFGS